MVVSHNFPLDFTASDGPAFLGPVPSLFFSSFCFPSLLACFVMKPRRKEAVLLVVRPFVLRIFLFSFLCFFVANYNNSDDLNDYGCM